MVGDMKLKRSSLKIASGVLETRQPAGYREWQENLRYPMKGVVDVAWEGSEQERKSQRGVKDSVEEGWKMVVRKSCAEIAMALCFGEGAVFWWIPRGI